MRSIAGYVTNKKRKTDRKETLKKLNKKLFEENLNRLLVLKVFFILHVFNFAAKISINRQSLITNS